jgi:CheY-like chemotaxis protein
MLKILMVDDEPDAEQLFRQNFRREIRKNQYEFIFAQSGQEALNALTGPDAPGVILLLSDINMPGMTGLELLDHVQKQTPELKVFMITAYGDPDTEADAKKRGAERLISKPVDFEQLKSTLADLSQEIIG